MESVALAFFDDPIIDEVVYEQGIIEPICLDENPGKRFRKQFPTKFIIHHDALKIYFRSCKNTTSGLKRSKGPFGDSHAMKIFSFGQKKQNKFVLSRITGLEINGKSNLS